MLLALGVEPRAAFVENGALLGESVRLHRKFGLTGFDRRLFFAQCGFAGAVVVTGGLQDRSFTLQFGLAGGQAFLFRCQCSLLLLEQTSLVFQPRRLVSQLLFVFAKRPVGGLQPLALDFQGRAFLRQFGTGAVEPLLFVTACRLAGGQLFDLLPERRLFLIERGFPRVEGLALGIERLPFPFELGPAGKPGFILAGQLSPFLFQNAAFFVKSFQFLLYNLFALMQRLFALFEGGQFGGEARAVAIERGAVRVEELLLLGQGFASGGNPVSLLNEFGIDHRALVLLSGLVSSKLRELGTMGATIVCESLQVLLHNFFAILQCLFALLEGGQLAIQARTVSLLCGAVRVEEQLLRSEELTSELQ